jgi:hypothetical protein
MNVRVHAKAVPVKSESKHQICRFPADSRQGEQLVHRVGYMSVIAINQFLAGSEDVNSFRFIKPDRVYRFPDFFFVKSQHFSRRSRY